MVHKTSLISRFPYYNSFLALVTLAVRRLGSIPKRKDIQGGKKLGDPPPFFLFFVALFFAVLHELFMAGWQHAAV